ncbi:MULTISPECIES: protein translocase subunit SecD [unclassified Vibrio]|uniref:protein translocase subunit SecD n=1 Tax=unclassified Vibrio TaxID=2614977 RepID=UPI001481F876|nr:MULTISPECIES: protein translocase subunit SecD [unclassified Vibrio]MDQ2190626.1 protein translocase subunit SecD [Vibrio sp. A14(2019)]MDQ2196834.1 protein translocase subunit SecD [Vibrio sp. 2017_1457_11]NNN75323.1 protein translocase subunit SecD [Vibrio sp. B7]NNN92102.1 protein translocase subunit SecD [Vibrio sp. B8-1]NNO07402.1 protein translocase subunit SecD [Vibrio sp. B4-12]
MKKTQNKKASARLINHYSAWKYIVLAATLVVLALSAIPTWYGEQPSIQLQVSAKNETLNSVVELTHLLEKNDIAVQNIQQQGGKTTLVFADEVQQTHARELLDGMIEKEDSITFSYVSVAPTWLTNLGFNPIKLGLDLRGGVQFLLNVDVDKAFQEQRDSMIDTVKDKLRDERLRSVKVNSEGIDGFKVMSNSAEDLNKINAFLKETYSGWDIQRSSDQLLIKPSKQNRVDFQSTTLQQNLKIMRDRIEELGITEAMVQRQGEHSIRIELPGVQDPSQAKNVIGATASLAFYEAKSPSEAFTSQDIVLKDENGRNVVLTKRPVLTGDHIVNARAGIDQVGMSEVNISLDHAGGKIMSDFSSKHIGKPMATVYREYTTNARGETERSEKVISVATIQSQLGSQFRITGAGSMEEAQQLALLLRAGSLTAPVTIVEERTIGASLGAENIQNGFAALALGMALTLTFMALWYRRLGWVANAALLFNMVCLIGLIALLPGAVLTLPGIAGLVLTVGMAVDTNVLIFERIKDKIAEGRSFAQAIDTGFSSAFSTILDANVTTMITAVILYSIGNGPIQGFALTLGLGIMTSMFSGVFASRAVINLIWGRDARRDVRV